MKKSKVSEMGYRTKRPSLSYSMENENFIKVKEEEEDHGVLIQDDLSREKHINKTILLNSVTFHYIKKEIINKLKMSRLCFKCEYMAILRLPPQKKGSNYVGP